MKHRSIVKWLALCVVVALGLVLTGCYIPPDEISAGTNDITLGSNNLPFDTIAPQATPTLTPTAAPVQSADPGAEPTVNWDDWGGSGAQTATPAPGSSTQPGAAPGGVPTIAVVTSAPTNTPGPSTPTPTPASLKNGMSGELVRKMQQRLKQLGYYTGSVDGDFGEGTEKAVREFQEANNLTVDGKAGKNTLNRLYSDSAVSKRSYQASQVTKTPKPTARPTPRPTATPKVSTNLYLEIGSEGKNVRVMQNRLIELGWLGGQADGEFGGATEYAVKAFQAREGLYDDGVAGPDTLEELYSSKAAKTSSVVSSIGVTLKDGMSGPSVRALQKRLKSLGYYDGSVDGSFGSGTVAAVKLFQQHNGLSADGKAGSSTLNRIYSDSAKSYSSSGNAAGSGVVSSTGYVTLREGDEGEAVRKLQRKLKDKGYYYGSVDGSYGSGTTAAVTLFQQQNDLRVDGVAGPATQRALFETSGSITYSSLKEGDEGSAVTNLQYTLYELGYYDGDIDGKYGITTRDAVRAFQIRNKLTVDGKAGSRTLAKMYSSSAVPALAKKEYETLEKGDRGEAVISLQAALVNLGYLPTKTGLYDDATVAAVKSFQKYNGLSVDGKAGSATLSKLYGGSAVAYPGP